MNNIISEIERLNNNPSSIYVGSGRGYIQLNEQLIPQKIMDEFETIQVRKSKGKYTLPGEYRLIKLFQHAMRLSLARVEDSQIYLFASIATAIEKIRSVISAEYEVKTPLILN